MNLLFWDNIVDWMLFNTFLALIPLVISMFVFINELWEKQALFRIFLFILTILYFIFLPNAPYVLTDIIHLVRQIKNYKYFGIDDDYIMFILIPEYLIFIFIGFSSYAISLQKFFKFLNNFGVSKKIIFFVKLFIHFTVCIGIYLGRIHRFNSWDIFLNLKDIFLLLVKEVSNINFYIYIFLLYVIIYVLFELFRTFYKSIFKRTFILK